MMPKFQTWHGKNSNMVGCHIWSHWREQNNVQEVGQKQLAAEVFKKIELK